MKINAVSSGHSILPPGQPVRQLTPLSEVSGRVTARMPINTSLASLGRDLPKRTSEMVSRIYDFPGLQSQATVLEAICLLVYFLDYLTSKENVEGKPGTDLFRHL